MREEGERGYPRALRGSGDFAWGFSELMGRERARVESDNRRLRACVRIFEACIELGKPCLFISSRGAKFWKTHLFRNFSSITHDADSCQYGRQWRGRLRLVCANVRTPELSVCRHGRIC